MPSDLIVGLFRETGAVDALMAWLSGRGVAVADWHVLIVLTAVLSNLVSNVPATLLLGQFLDAGQPQSWYVLAILWVWLLV